MRIALPLLLSLAAAPVAAQDRDYPPHPSVAKYYLLEQGFFAGHLIELPNGHHAVEATINGETGLFLVDTGATITTLDINRAGHFSIARNGTPIRVHGVSGSGRARVVAGTTFRIFDRDLPVDRLMLTDLGPTTRALADRNGRRFDGIIGQDLLSRYEGIIDVNAKILFFRIADAE